MNNKDLKERILTVSKKYKLSHISSCLSVLPILIDIYSHKNLGDVIALSGAHSHLAHLIVKAEFGELPPEKVEEYIQQDIHCNRKYWCDITGGSLGHAGGIVIGMAIAHPKIMHYLIITDGSVQEGSELEALRLITDMKLKNVKVYANINGFTAVQEIDKMTLANRLYAFCPDINIRYTENGEDFAGVQGHYKVIQ